MTFRVGGLTDPTIVVPQDAQVTVQFSGLVGDPTASGQGASTFTFQAGPAGTYQYICLMPGHAQMGMHGAFIVR